MFARPRDGRIAVCIPRLLVGAIVDQVLDHRFVTVCRGTMKRRLALSSDVAHESPGFFSGNRLCIYISAIFDEQLQNVDEIRTAGFTQGIVERGLACVGNRVVYIRTLCDQERSEEHTSELQSLAYLV